MEKQIRDLAGALAAVRRHPCLLFISSTIQGSDVLTVRKALGGHEGGPLDAIVASPGGDVGAAYLVARELRRRFARLTVYNGGRCVPGILTLPIPKTARTGTIGVCNPPSDFSARPTSSLNRNADPQDANRRSSTQGSLLQSWGWRPGVWDWKEHLPSLEPFRCPRGTPLQRGPGLPPVRIRQRRTDSFGEADLAQALDEGTGERAQMGASDLQAAPLSAFADFAESEWNPMFEGNDTAYFVGSIVQHLAKLGTARWGPPPANLVGWRGQPALGPHIKSLRLVQAESRERSRACLRLTMLDRPKQCPSQ